MGHACDPQFFLDFTLFHLVQLKAISAAAHLLAILGKSKPFASKVKSKDLAIA